MQYALTKFSNRAIAHRLLDVCEATYLGLEKRTGKVQVDRPDTVGFDTAPLRLVYGAFLPNPETDEGAATDLLGDLDGNILQVSLPGRVTYLGLEEIAPEAAVRFGGKYYVPFGALIRTRIPFADDLGQYAVTAYPYCDEESPEDNVVRREGILALKSEERRFMKRISPKNWRQWVDVAQVRRAAAQVYESDARGPDREHFACSS